MYLKFCFLIFAYTLLGLYRAYEQLPSKKYFIAIGELISGVGKALIVLSYFYTVLAASILLMLFIFVLIWDVMYTCEIGVFDKIVTNNELWPQKAVSIISFFIVYTPVIAAMAPVIQNTLT